MRRVKLLSAAGLFRCAAACLLAAAAAAHAGAQTRAGEADATPPPTQSAATNADEEFELNIEQRRISEKDFRAETAVETDGSHGLQLGVGVALRATDIEVLLLGVRGRVRFRGNLAPVLRLLESRRPPPAQAPPR